MNTQPEIFPMKQQAMDRVGEFYVSAAESKKSMTTLTLPNAEQIALIDEAARQARTGEAQADYWLWHCNAGGVDLTYNYPRFTDATMAQSYCPAPAHPHYATYCRWQQLVDDGEVAKGWWILQATHSSGTYCYYCLDKQSIPWWVDCTYVITKSDNHPDNIKPALKLIDWAKVPALSQTNHGLWLGFEAHYTGQDKRGLALCGTYVKLVPMSSFRIVQQTTFTHLPKGTPPPVVEGLVFDYEYITGIRGRNTVRSVNFLTPDSACAYRVICLAPGYTDNPEEAK
jgi:hypothetical protein